MKGWVSLVGWPIADSLPTKWSPVQLLVRRRTGKVRRSGTSILPLCYELWDRSIKYSCSKSVDRGLSWLQVLEQMKRELRRKMEQEIGELQRRLWQDEDDVYFRELDAERMRCELHLAQCQAPLWLFVSLTLFIIHWLLTGGKYWDFSAEIIIVIIPRWCFMVLSLWLQEFTRFIWWM